MLSILCCIGLRTILEAICIDKQIVDGSYINSKGKEVISQSLIAKINTLALKGFITAGQSEVLHELRFLGNTAAHEISAPSIKEIETGIEIIELMIDNIYEINVKANVLKAKRNTISE